MRFQALVALIVFAVLVVLLSSLATLAAFVSADMVEYALGSQFAGIDREFNWLERRCAHMQCFVETSTGGGVSDRYTHETGLACLGIARADVFLSIVTSFVCPMTAPPRFAWQLLPLSAGRLRPGLQHMRTECV